MDARHSGGQRLAVLIGALAVLGGCQGIDAAREIRQQYGYRTDLPPRIQVLEASEALSLYDANRLETYDRKQLAEDATKTVAAAPTIPWLPADSVLDMLGLDRGCLEASNGETYLEQLATSVLPVFARGQYRPVTFEMDGVQPRTLPPDLSDHVSTIVNAVQRDATHAAREVRVLFFIHGGLNRVQGGLRRAAEHARLIRCFKHRKYHPIFVMWPSDGLGAFSDQSYHNQQGRFDEGYKPLAGWVHMFADFSQGVVRAPTSLMKSYSRWEQSYKEANDDFDAFKAIRENDNVLREHFGWHEDGPWDESFWARVRSIAFAPSTAFTAPFVEGGGRTSWDGMIAHARSLFHPPAAFYLGERTSQWSTPVASLDDPGIKCPQDGDGGTGALACLARALQRLDEKVKFRITLIAHSMGAIVANDLLQYFPRLPIDEVVYMGGAATIRETQQAVRRAVESGNSDLKFYNLSLLSDIEAREQSFYGLVPTGSLLEWVDDMYLTPASRMDRTVGQWRNIINAYRTFHRKELRMMWFKRFGGSCFNPTAHGAFDDLGPAANVDGKLRIRPSYWDPRFWTADPSNAPNHTNVISCAPEQVAPLLRAAK